MLSNEPLSLDLGVRVSAVGLCGAELGVQLSPAS